MPPSLPKKLTSRLFSTESFTSSTIWPALSSQTRNFFPVMPAKAFWGKGQREMGRIMPTLTPSARARFMALTQTRAMEP